jgi:tRNA pseudouridine13 synthase
MTQDRVYLNTHKALNFKFTQNKFDFIVEEIPARNFKQKGNFFIMKVQKEYLSTMELIYAISKELNIQENLIGYAGLKDKYATTTQYISIPLNKSRGYEAINSKSIKVLETYTDDQKIKIGDLKGNKFTITLKDIDPNSVHVIYQNISRIQKHGMPNYFGYQRFGRDMTFEKAKRVAYGEDHFRDKKIENLLVSTYQSYFFNSWLNKRISLSKEKGLNKLEQLEGSIFFYFI